MTYPNDLTDMSIALDIMHIEGVLSCGNHLSEADRDGMALDLILLHAETAHRAALGVPS